MNLAIAAMVVALGLWLGFVPYLVLQLVAIGVAGAAGVWLFYVQHQFEDAYWDRAEDWDYTAAALQGSSFYELPRVLRWFSGNIGYHHIHHLSPRVPNYNLERCHRSARMFEDVKPLTLFRSLKSLRLHLWDEGLRRLVSFRHARRERRRARRNRREAPTMQHSTRADNEPADQTQGD
jgi:omega-6 fatty acid desaturase (delta-12 desaturase)